MTLKDKLVTAGIVLGGCAAISGALYGVIRIGADLMDDEYVYGTQVFESEHIGFATTIYLKKNEHSTEIKVKPLFGADYTMTDLGNNGTVNIIEVAGNVYRRSEPNAEDDGSKSNEDKFRAADAEFKDYLGEFDLANTTLDDIF